MKFVLISLVAISAQAACLWDPKDERLYCSWGEVKPAWAEQCAPPSPEPMRSDTGSVYCGKQSNVREQVQGGPTSYGVAPLKADKSPVMPAELHLDCVADPAPPLCKPVKSYKDCSSPNITRSSVWAPGIGRASAATDWLLCCDPSVNEIRVRLKCKTEVK